MQGQHCPSVGGLREAQWAAVVFDLSFVTVRAMAGLLACLFMENQPVMAVSCTIHEAHITVYSSRNVPTLK